MGALQELSSSEELSSFLSTNAFSLVCFSATWCGPCKASKPQLEALAASYDSDPSINVSCGIAYEHNLGEDIQNYRVRAFPTYALFQKSSEVGRVEGVNFEGIKSLVGQHCKAHDFGSGGAVSAADARAPSLARVKKIGQWDFEGLTEEEKAAKILEIESHLKAMQVAREETKNVEIVNQQRDEILFRQRESSHLGDCPICFLPLPLDLQQSVFTNCCSQIVCEGCIYANQKREIMGRLKLKCPFCRAPVTNISDEEIMRKTMDRAEVNDPAAMFQLGYMLYEKGEHLRAFEYYSKAASLGNADGHFRVALCYSKGVGVEKDEKKLAYHMEQASIGGHPMGRYNLGAIEWNNGKKERAVKHWLIAARQGEENSMNQLKKVYKNADQKELISKEDLAAALRGYQAAVDATKSKQREEAKRDRK